MPLHSSLTATVVALPRVQPRHAARGISGPRLPGPRVRARVGVHDGVRHVQPGDGRLRAVQHQTALRELRQLGGLQEERLRGKDCFTLTALFIQSVAMFCYGFS